MAALMIAESGRMRPGAISRRRAMGRGWSTVRARRPAPASRTLWMPDVRRQRSRRVGEATNVRRYSNSWAAHSVLP